MPRTALAAALSCALALSVAGCVTQRGGMSDATGAALGQAIGAAADTVPSTRLASIIAKGRAYAVRACGIEPTAASVAAVVSSLADAALPGASAVSGIAFRAADAFCAAVTTGTAYAAGSAPLPPRPRKGQVVTGTVVLPNGQVVPVAGTVRK